MLMCSGWIENIDVLLVDLMCGLGIIVIEVVYIVCNIVLGIKCMYWGFIKWFGYEEKFWDDLVE